MQKLNDANAFRCIFAPAMSRQRNIFAEILVILAITIAGSFWVWTHTSFPKNPVEAKTPETVIDYVEAPGNPIQKANSADAENWKEGRSLFKSNCASCHNPKVAQTGPALMGVTKRWDDAGIYKEKPGKYWLHEWVRDWSTVVKSGYPYAMQISKYSPSEMNRFPNLSDSDIEKILIYVETPDAGQVAFTGKTISCYMPVY